jgi:hypothetical protein
MGRPYFHETKTLPSGNSVRRAVAPLETRADWAFLCEDSSETDVHSTRGHFVKFAPPGLLHFPHEIQAEFILRIEAESYLNYLTSLSFVSVLQV